MGNTERAICVKGITVAKVVMGNIAETLGEMTGKLLVAMPGMGDPRFDQSVVFLCEHSAKGAMGLIVNKRANGMVLGDVLAQLDVDVAAHVKGLPVYFGGPVEVARGFVLHSPDFQSALQTVNVGTEFAMTVTMDVLEEMGKGEGPKNAQMMLGYAGWGPDQLENEIAHNGWLICDATSDLVFGADDSGKWVKALASMGLDPLTLSATAGHA
jgi:putative transcriptional regulator